MAHVVGVPRRDPCQKCQLPVFLAERLAVGKTIYHRTCLKCARCGSQLTPGSFYETEEDNVYCCETCPDEEEAEIGAANSSSGSSILRDQENVSSHMTDTTETVKPFRNSIADRLAFFEQKPAAQQQELVGKTASVSVSTSSSDGNHKLLQKNVSDEEKSKCLWQPDGGAAGAASSSHAAALSAAHRSFLKETIDSIDGDSQSDGNCESISTSIDNNKNEINRTDTDTDDENTSEGASIVDEATSAHPPPSSSLSPAPIEAADVLNKRFTTTFSLTLDTSAATAIANAEPSTEIGDTSEINSNQLATSTAVNSDCAINNNVQPQPEQQEPQQHRLEHENAAAVQTTVTAHFVGDNDCSTKEVIADNKSQLEAQGAAAADGSETEQLVASHTTGQQADNDDVEMRGKGQPSDGKNNEDMETTARLSVVRARLRLFEETASANNNQDEVGDTTVQTDNNQTLSDKTNIEQAIATETVDDSIDIQSVDVDAASSEVADCPELSQPLGSTSAKHVGDSDGIVATACEPESLSKVPLSIELEVNKVAPNITNDVYASTIDAEAEEVNKTAIEQSLTKQTSEQSTPLSSSAPTISSKLKQPQSQQQQQQQSSIEIYPDALNPFNSGDDDDDVDDANEENNKENITPRPRSINMVKSNKVQVGSVNLQPLKSKDKSSVSFNPFDSSDDEIELEKSGQKPQTPTSLSASKVPPPRPPPPRLSRNPFGDEADDTNFTRGSSLTSSLNRTPVPTPRTNLSLSQTPTPEPTPRLNIRAAQPLSASSLHTDSYYGSTGFLSSTPHSGQRNSDVRGSNNSLASSAGGTVRSRKQRRAPAPPVGTAAAQSSAPIKELFPSAENLNTSKASTPSSSAMSSPKSSRKKRIAPAPPKPARLDPTQLPQITVQSDGTSTNANTDSKNLLSYPLQSELDSKLSDEEKALLEGNQNEAHQLPTQDITNREGAGGEPRSLRALSRSGSLRLIPLDPTLLQDDDDEGSCGVSKSDDLKQQQRQQKQQLMEEETNVVYRRILVPSNIDTPTHETTTLADELSNGGDSGFAHDRQLEKLKDNKEAQNRNRQSQNSASSSAEDSDPCTIFNKSVHGKWKRRKGPAPPLPIPPRKVLQMLPLQEIRHELEIIEVQQQGLEKQGVILEKMIRDRCEGQNANTGAAESAMSQSNAEVTSDQIGKGQACVEAHNSATGKESAAFERVQNSKEVEDLILQLFELVNEKNELFRRQAELMYLRRQHRLEQEQADIEYEIRVLMAQPERNKTDTDKAREEVLIARLVELVQLRNEVIECLEMDRLREAEEDLSIKQRLELHNSKRDCGGSDHGRKSSVKLSKKEKKKQKEAKKLIKSKKLDADKDADETELKADKERLKKKKKGKLFF